MDDLKKLAREIVNSVALPGPSGHSEDRRHPYDSATMRAFACQCVEATFSRPAELVHRGACDQIALDAAAEIMALVYGSMPKGGSVQIKAQVQVAVLGAMRTAIAATPAPQPECPALRQFADLLRVMQPPISAQIGEGMRDALIAEIDQLTR